jgi:cobyrinic acid a,c-diamide synthase
MSTDDLYISALRKSSGKTTVAVGLAAAAAGRGRTVETFKKGPAFIDPMWLGQAAGAPCLNLDFHTMGNDEILAAFAAHAAGAGAFGLGGRSTSCA